jgi:ribosomal protein S18 acetylase RimI-like enzyme
MREAIRTSPDSFLATLAHVEDKKDDYWIGQIRSSTWVVAERDRDVVGVAVSKFPEQGKDRESPQDSRYIESVWIDPAFRGNRLGERLIRYLMEVEIRKNPGISQFLLWVFETNSRAISLYERMNFTEMPDRNTDLMLERNTGPMTEIKYRLHVDSETSADISRSVGEPVLLDEKLKHGVTYRVLGEGDSA